MDNQTESNPNTDGDDTLDPRIQIELDRLNHANEAINQLELQLDDARKTLKELWDASQIELSQVEKSIGSAVVKARSYYEARIKLRETREVLTKAKHRFERAQALHVAAKELAIVSADHIDEAIKLNENATAWSETYRQALEKTAEAEREKYLADFDQQRAEKVYFEIEKLVEKLEKDSRRSINKSKPYYELKVEFSKELDFHKRKVTGLESCVNEAKTQYQQSLKNLELISNEIHEQRNQGKLSTELGERTPGVGEEHLDLTQIEPPVLTRTPTDTSTMPQKKTPSDVLLRSYLLRTESLPTGIFTNTSDRYSPEGNEATQRTSDFSDQFILTSRQAPQSTLIDNSQNETHSSYHTDVERLSSFSSQATDESDDKTGSLHALSDDELDHLASAYHPFSPELSSEADTIDEFISQLQNSKLQAKTFFRNLFKSNSVKN